MHKARTGIKVYDTKLRLEQRHFMSSFALLRVWSFQGSFFFFVEELLTEVNDLLQASAWYLILFTEAYWS